MKRSSAIVLILAFVFGIKPGLADTLDSVAIAKLVDNNTWHLNWAACMGGSDGCRTFWDFGSDGTVCARAIDAKRDDKCADEGKWRIEENKLCWELTWFGGGEGFKSVCVLIEKASDGNYETTRAGGFGIKFFQFAIAQ